MSGLTIPALLAESEARFGERVFIRDNGQNITFKTMGQTARLVAKGLISLGFQPGDRLALWAPNRWEWVATALGIQLAGGVLIPLNTRLRGMEVGAILRRAKALGLISIGNFLRVDFPAMLAKEALPDLRHLIVLGDYEGGTAPHLRWDELLRAGDSIEDADDAARAAAVKADDVCDIMFTSGTTGEPKGAVFTHAMTLEGARGTVEISTLGPDDRYAAFGPFSHNAAYKAGWLAALMSGASMVTMSDQTPDGVAKLIQHEKISILPSPPTVLQGLLAHPEFASFDLSTLRRVTTGGTTVPVKLLYDLRKAFPNAVVATGYGMTEVCGSATNTLPEDSLEIIAGTAGRAIPGTQVRCVTADGFDAKPGETGEVWIRDAKTMLGYLDNPEATAKALDPEGWFHSGDLGAFDDAGNLKIIDRLGDMYIAGGFNCYPAEIEKALLQIKEIAAASVIGIPDERLGQVGRAFIIRAPGAVIDESQILSWCKLNIANYKIPRSIVFVDELPLNATGKVVKAKLRAYS
jgi:acyl-CoA synthetase (AMP-forming)/AMP-acid ligase II